MNADPLITRMEPLRPRGLRVRIHLDVGDPLEVALEALERSGLGVGDALPGSRRPALLDADAQVSIREAALSLLSHRARTRAELRRRLLSKGFRPEHIDPVLDRLQEGRLLDDDAVASAFVRDRVRHRPRGRARLAGELRTRGVDGDTAERAIGRVLAEEHITESDLALAAAEAWLRRQGASVLGALAHPGRSPEAEKARLRLRGHLARRGFQGDAVRLALDRIGTAAGSTDPAPTGAHRRG